MKFSTKEDIEAPIDVVFREVTDFAVFERAALRRGAQVHRTDEKSYPDTLITWEISFPFRGRNRNMRAELTECDPPNRVEVRSTSGGLGGEVVIELVALSRGRTRMIVALDIKPKNLTTRVMVQSMRLTKNKLKARYRMRVARFAGDIEDRYKDGKSG
ncbi:SRPBCC family protein [Profundibacter sp.]|uniref:SRPBCC family protein n=1 Tax=Profundibacter sp. TaxID=3101071 RepID=UPI003D0A5D82